MYRAVMIQPRFALKLYHARPEITTRVFLYPLLGVTT
uniref:Uncharacterized protein n=1 Tax=Siphoviridae sp. ctnNB1 TaxID=2825660 RepID=A0A8S5UV76_9CAUD|nr:MAG TPA: hypothetical protein [Siphoviridae sp. ctnNB1]